MRNRNRTSPIPLGEGTSKPDLKHAPFPGIIDEERWEIQEGRWPSFVDRTGDVRVMQVPLEDEEVARKLRLHEQAHVRWTPVDADKDKEHYGVEPLTVDACEDGRIIGLMNRRNKEWESVNYGYCILTPGLIKIYQQDFADLAARLQEPPDAAPKPLDPFQRPPMRLLRAAQLIASSRGYYEEQIFDHMASENDLDWITDAVNHLHHKHLSPKGIGKKEPTFQNTLEYAEELEGYFKELEQNLQDASEMLADIDLPGSATPEMLDQQGQWGEMRIQQAPLSERLDGLPTKKTRPSDLGAVPRYMHRLVSDQRVFGRRRKQRKFQGTVLIDHSGSMSLDAGQVDEILHRWPAVTIATYSGNNTDGVLRIVARNGRRAARKWLSRPAGADNMIDGPALEWLARERGPRIWISDGGVTGIGGQTPDLLLDAARICKRGRIKRIPDVQQLLERR